VARRALRASLVCKPRIEIGGKIGNQATAELEDKAQTRVQV